MSRPGSLRGVAAACLLAALAACSKSEAPPSATGALATKLCGVLRQKAGELGGMSEVGARAQLVMAIATAFDADAKSLATVSSDIDAIAAAGCLEARAPLLAATRAASLQEAVR